jgi:hypothetical protein
MSRIPENLVVITDGEKKGRPGFVERRPGDETVTIRIASGTIQKREGQFRPFTMDDFIVV